MTAVAWREAPIAKAHDRMAFDCGEPDLNLHQHRFARRNRESGSAKCFVAAPSDAPMRIMGFHTLSPTSLELSRTPALARKGVARYDVAVFRLGCLAGGALERGLWRLGQGGAPLKLVLPLAVAADALKRGI